MSKLTNSAVNPDLEGDSVRGKKITLCLCVMEMLGEILMLLNFLVFTRGVSYHRHIPFGLELALLIALAAAICVFDVFTVTGNRITRVLGAAFIAATFFYNGMDFFLGLAMLGAENWRENIPFFVSCTAVCAIKLVWARNIFKNTHVRAYFYKVNKARYGL